MNETFEHLLVPYNGATGGEKAFRKSTSLAQSIHANLQHLVAYQKIEMR